MQNKAIVVETFSCMNFHDWENGELGIVKKKINKIHQSLSKEKWWKDITSEYHVMMPIMYAICHMDESVANVEKFWMAW